MHRIIYEHGLESLGNVRAAEKVAALSHGVLLVQNDGDDISLPNRVSRTVAAWMKDGMRAKILFCEADCINKSGFKTGKRVSGLSVFHPRGAMTAYSSDVFKAFPPVTEVNAYDDRPYAFRARLLGSVLNINEVLLLYRVGGDSTCLGCQNRYNTTVHSLAGVRQNILDLRTTVNCELTSDEIKDICDRLKKLEKSLLSLQKWYCGRTVLERFHNRPCSVLRTIKEIAAGRIAKVLYLIELFFAVLPARIGEPLRNVVQKAPRYAQCCMYKLKALKNRL